MGVGAFALGSRLQRERALAACAAEGASVGATWNSDAESRLREGLLATAAPYAQIAADRVSASFSSQASAWSSARVRACQRARVDGEWDDDTLDRATWCLEDRRLELEALVEELSRADATIVQNAATAAVGLSSITPCLDPLRLAAMPALPSDRDAVLEVKRALWRVGAQRAAGAYATGLEEARDALARAEALSWAPLVATARWRLGSLLYHTGAYAEAERALEDAFFLARESGAQEVEFEAATRLTYTIGYLMARHDDGLRWRRHADIALTLMGEDETSLRRATHMHRVATVYYAKGAFAEAEAISERALATQLEALGAEHPDVASALNNLGSMQYATGAYDRARVHLSRALAIYEETLGPQHPHVADALINLANVNYFEGSYEEAKTLYRRALVIHERALGESHARVAESLNNLAELLRLTGEYAESKALAERALEIFERALGPKHPSVAEPLLNVATVSALTGDHARARNLYERALAIQQEAYGDEHVALAHALTGLAEVALAQARPGDAVTLAERAAKLRESGEAPPEQLADTRFVLARALCERGSAEAKAGAKASAKADASAGARARALAQEARAVYQAAKGKERALAEVDVFLASDCVAGGT
ncbi:MAG: tetratricopeptide repeat protein [Myxococcales bacterium]|nr:tetratricopeptide repeat protein [Myxococcales bacterium]